MEFAIDVPGWHGKVHTAEYMTFQQLLKWDRAVKNVGEIKMDDEPLAFHEALLPHALKIIERWEVKGLPEKVSPEEFPASSALVARVVEIISDLYEKTNTDELDPKAQGQS